jgi:multidrug efflux pump subunit AcrA (membrane-fusion protein)
MSDTITLDFLSRQQTQILAEIANVRDDMAAFRDDMTILTAISMRVEASVTSLTTDRAMHSRHARLERRVDTLEDTIRDVQSEVRHHGELLAQLAGTP